LILCIGISLIVLTIIGTIAIIYIRATSKITRDTKTKRLILPWDFQKDTSGSEAKLLKLAKRIGKVALAGVLSLSASLLAQELGTNREKVRSIMISEDTRITKESEDCVLNCVQYNSEKTSHKIAFYLAPPEIQNEIIMDAMDCARQNKLIFSPKTEINEYDQYKIVEGYVEETPTNIIPLLLTNDECLNITKHVYDAGGFDKDMKVLMRSILNDRTIMRNLEYSFQVKSQVVLLSYYDKIGIIAGYINMQKAKP
jgi:hypothetical protein